MKTDNIGHFEQEPVAVSATVIQTTLGKVFPEHRKIVIEYRADIAHLLGPHGQPFESQKRWWLAMPYEVEVVRLLRNHDIEVPSPVRCYYDWAGGKPFESQILTADMLTIYSRAYVLSEMGVGKTRAVLFAYDYLRSIAKASRMLVVAPLSTLVTVWENEIFENFPHLRAVVLYGDRKKRAKLLSVDADVYIINHDGVGVLKNELEARRDIDVLALDELATYRNRGNTRWKTIMPLVRRSSYAWGLTGSPTPNEPTDAYGQVRLLTPENISYTFKAFREETMRQISQFKWVERADANQVVKRVMSPQVRFVRSECFDLPETTYSTRAIDMEPAAAKAYKKMADELAVQVKARQITAANEGVKLSKLLQISAGFVYDATGKGQYIGGLARIKTVFEIVESSANKVLVFAPFRFYVELLGRALAKKYSVGIIHGDVSKSARDSIFTSFQKTSSPRIIVAHPQTMAHGLTLTAADTIVWALPTTSLEIYQQANARITRPGQQNHTHVIHVQATAAESHVYNRLKRKAKVQGVLLDMFQHDTAQLGGGNEP